MEFAVRRGQAIDALPFVVGPPCCRKPNARNSLKFALFLLWLAPRAMTAPFIK